MAEIIGGKGLRRRNIPIALKGHNKKAQGNALGSEQIAKMEALKGRDRQVVAGLFRSYRAESHPYVTRSAGHCPRLSYCAPLGHKMLCGAAMLAIVVLADAKMSSSPSCLQAILS